MERELYCWRCDVEMPMLDGDEWARNGPLLSGSADPVTRQNAFDLDEEMTGLRETNINAIWHHRLKDCDPPCVECGTPSRIPKANLCAACGTTRDVE